MKKKDLRFLLQIFYALIILGFMFFANNVENILAQEILNMELHITVFWVVFLIVVGFALWHMFIEYIVNKYGK